MAYFATIVMQPKGVPEWMIDCFSLPFAMIYGNRGKTCPNGHYL